MAIYVNRELKQFHLQNANTSYILKVMPEKVSLGIKLPDGRIPEMKLPEGTLVNLYWGKKLPDGDLGYLMQSFNGAASFDSMEGRLPYEMPFHGVGYYGDAALKVKNAQGNDLVYLTYAGYDIYKGKKPLKGLPATYAENDDEAETLVIYMEDKLTGLKAEFSYTVFAGSDAIARSVKLINGAEDPLRITRLPVASVPFYGRDFDVIHLHGAWARERAVERLPLTHAGARVESMRGASGHEENPFIAMCRPGTDEFTGEAWAFNFVYSGSFLAEAEVHNSDNARMSIGMNPSVFEWLLEKGEEFQSPEVVMVYSDKGLNGMSDIYHKLYRTRLVRGEWRDKERPILINNWEATYFDFNTEKILKIAEKASAIGIELFVLDDGWFGVRNIDNCSLGDWVVNEDKLPGGLAPLAEKINSYGMKFGLWFEPEMISPNSDLYRAHPDWCLHIDGRRRTEQRQQLILDMSRRDVQDYVVEAVSSVLRSAHIEYVKWDMNRNMTEYFSAKAAPERQMETQHRYMLGLYDVMERIVSAFPYILFESCSGGGGRFDAGMLYYMPQTWTSDDTDAMERLKIQYGTSYAYPTSAMGAHISAVPNHQTGRVTSMDVRGDVAMSGNFGFELDLGKLSEEDLAVAAKYVERVKKLRGILQKGTFTRIVSPFEGNYCSWQFVSADAKQAILCAFRR
ncbi:MAG: alpha-galactosidase, partial [Clostridia bacterium]|nr:alpha-galactosidase [Clostridia bacterium]